MKPDTQPGLGSGALTGYELAGCADRIDLIVAHAVEKKPMLAADWDRFAAEIRRALSLSSPIEPPATDMPPNNKFVEWPLPNHCPVCGGFPVDANEIAAGVAKLRGRASSEIREALDVETLARAGHKYWREQKWANDPLLRKTWLQATPEFDGMNGSARAMFLTFTQGIVDALAPSRQGAGPQ